MPTTEQIAAWKTEHNEVFSAHLGGKDYIFRAVTFAEYESTLDGPDWSSADAEDELVRIAVLWPQDVDPAKMSAGAVSSLASSISAESGFNNAYRTIALLEEWRTKYSGLRGQMDAVIMTGLPNLDPKSLRHMTMYEKAEMCVLAENVINMRLQANGVPDADFKLEVYTPEEIAAMNAQKISDDGNATVSDPIAQKLLGMA